MTTLTEQLLNQLKAVSQLNTCGRLDQLTGMSGELTEEEWRMLVSTLKDEVSIVDGGSKALMSVVWVAGLAYAVSFKDIPRMNECARELGLLLDNSETTLTLDVDESSSDEAINDQVEVMLNSITDAVYLDDPYAPLLHLFVSMSLLELGDSCAE